MLSLLRGNADHPAVYGRAPLSLIDHRGTGRPWYRAGRWLAVPASTAILAMVLVAVGMRGVATQRLDVTLSVLKVEDPLHIGATTRVVVDLVNNEDRTIHPRFSVSSLSYPFYWRSVSGPEALPAHQRARYVIEAPDGTAAPQDGATFQVRVNDAQSITYVIAKSITVKPTSFPVVNPGLKLWTQRDPATGLFGPVGWSFYKHQGSGDQTTVKEASVFGVQGAYFHVIQDGKPDPGSWSHTGLTQNIPFPEQPFGITVLSRAPYRADSAGWPLNAFGIEINDGVNPLLWLLFQQTGFGDLDYDIQTGQHIHVYDVPAGTWQRVSIDLPAIYQRLRWTRPARVSIKLFIAAASTRPDNIDGYIAGITPAAAPSPAP